MLGRLFKRGTPPPVTVPAPPIFMPDDLFGEAYKDGHAYLTLNRYRQAMLENGLFDSSELPPEIGLIEYAVNYTSRVENGGHSSYYLFCEMQASELEGAAAGLRLIGAKPLDDCLDRMITVVEDAEQTEDSDDWFDKLEEALEPVDAAFYQDNCFDTCLRDWLARSDLVTRLPRDAWEAQLAAATDLNPAHAERVTPVRIAQLNAFLTDRVEAPFRAAFAGLLVDGTNLPWEMQGRAGGTRVDLDAPLDVADPFGDPNTAWGLKTNTRKIMGHNDHKAVHLHHVQGEDRLGRAIRSVPMDQITPLLQDAADARPSVAAVHLLKAAGIAEDPAYFGWLTAAADLPRGTNRYVLRLGEASRYVVELTPKDATLKPFPGGADQPALAQLPARQLRTLTKEFAFRTGPRSAGTRH